MSTIITQPLSPEQLRAQVSPQGFITADVLVDINNVIEGDFEAFLDDLSVQVTGTEIGLRETSYSVVGAQDNMIVVRVEASVGEYLAELDEDEQDESCSEDFATADDLLCHLEVVHGVDPNTVEAGDEESVHEQILDGDR